MAEMTKRELQIANMKLAKDVAQANQRNMRLREANQKLRKRLESLAHALRELAQEAACK